MPGSPVRSDRSRISASQPRSGSVLGTVTPHHPALPGGWGPPCGPVLPLLLGEKALGSLKRALRPRGRAASGGRERAVSAVRSVSSRALGLLEPRLPFQEMGRAVLPGGKEDQRILLLPGSRPSSSPSS